MATSFVPSVTLRWIPTCQKPATAAAAGVPAPPPRAPPRTQQALTPAGRRRLGFSTITAASAADPPPSDGPSTRGRGFAPGQGGAGSLRAEAEASNREVYDRLIDVFLSRSPEDWRKLIAHSGQWPSLSAGVLARMEERAGLLAAEGDAEGEDEARRLRRAARRLATVSGEMKEYGDLVAMFRAAPSREWEPMVARHRPSLGTEFFGYVELRVRAAAGAAAAAAAEAAAAAGRDAEKAGGKAAREAEALAALGTQVAALVEAHDRVLSDEEALGSAADRFADLLSSETMEAAEAKLDELAASGQLDPALLLTMARAYSGVKETDATKDEVKDIMAHLYFKAKESFARQAPPEARILKFLLAVESPADRAALLDQAFTPGPELSTSDDDYVHTTPEALLNTVENVLAVYDSAKKGAAGGAEATARLGGGPGGMAGEAAALMNPEVIQRLREMQAEIRKRYM